MNAEYEPALPLCAALCAAWPPHRWRHETLLAAVSGGADSVALLRALRAVRLPGSGRIVAAHYNHQLRAAAEVDEAFVSALCGQLGIECHVGRPENPPAIRSEAAARQARYAFLESLACRLGAGYVAVAHTADDQVETVLHRLLRGTGLRGLAGMPSVRRLGEAVTLIRPLLAVRRSEVLAYLAEIGQPFREDETNLTAAYTRNRIRLELLPRLREAYNPRVDQALLRLARQAGEAHAFLARQAEALLDRAAVLGENCASLNPGELAGQPPLLIREMFVLLWRKLNWPERAMGLRQWRQLAALALAEPPAAQTFPGDIQVEKQKNAIRLVRRTA